MVVEVFLADTPTEGGMQENDSSRGLIENMRAQRARAFCLGIVVAWSAFLAGCATTSRKEMTREIRQARVQAYQRYESRTERENQQQPRISGKLSIEDSLKLTLAHNKMLQQTMEERASFAGRTRRVLSGVSGRTWG